MPLDPGAHGIDTDVRFSRRKREFYSMGLRTRSFRTARVARGCAAAIPLRRRPCRVVRLKAPEGAYGEAGDRCGGVQMPFPNSGKPNSYCNLNGFDYFRTLIFTNTCRMDRLAQHGLLLSGGAQGCSLVCGTVMRPRAA